MGSNDDLAEEILETYARARIEEHIVFMTYGDLASRLGREGQHRLLGDPLDRVRKLCAVRGLPDVATMIIDQQSLQAGTVKPSSKAFEKYAGWRDLRAGQACAIAYDWASVFDRPARDEA